MKKITIQRKILFEILAEHKEGLTLGDLRVKFYQRHKPKINHGYHNEMRRNSRMSSWLNQLWRDGKIYIERFEFSDCLYFIK